MYWNYYPGVAPPQETVRLAAARQERREEETGSQMSAAAELEASAQRERELRKIVLTWLNRKGYTRAEEQFRKEAEIAGAQPLLRPTSRRARRRRGALGEQRTLHPVAPCCAQRAPLAGGALTEF